VFQSRLRRVPDLPGPEAVELCMFFGYLASGVAAGLGFILPGFVLMLVASYLYVCYRLWERMR
jgi:chromate transport protein ChrA